MLCIYLAIPERNSGENDLRCVKEEAAGAAITSGICIYMYIYIHIYILTHICAYNMHT
jgi:hypothetical protein